MANVTLDWGRVEFSASMVKGWRDFKREVDLSANENLLSSRAVYVIRVRRPYSFSYGEKHSPVAYIGKGNAQERITSHLKSWIPRLYEKIPDLVIAIDFCEPRIRKKGAICEDVEADLIKYFVDSYGELPLRNKNTPRGALGHTYVLKEITKVIHPGKGQGYEWAIRPLPSSHFFKPKK